jgi:DMSO/TMAO reductase YedYZ molybdopterin-dependent catalytic subunit
MGVLRLFLWGILCGTAAVGASFLIRIFLGGSYLPELAAQTLTSLVPGVLESKAVENLGPLAKDTAFVGSSAVNVVVLALIPFFVSRLHLTPGGRPRKAVLLAGLSYALMILLGLVFTFISTVSSNPTGIATLLLSLLVPSAIFGVSMSSFRPVLPTQAPVPYPTQQMRGKFSRKRRLFIQGAAGTAVAAVILYYGIGFLFSKGPPQSNTNETSALLASQVTPNDDFYRVDINVIPPSVDSGSWNLNLHGLVNAPMTLNYDKLTSLPAIEEYATLQCVSNMVGGDLMSTALWKGVNPTADYVVFRCYDGYDVGIPLDRATMDGTILAYQMNGATLPVEHGFPVRAIVPGLYGMMNAKWITEIELTQGVYQGFWQRKGWENDAHYQTVSTILTPGDSQLRDRFPLPSSMTDVTGSPIAIAGIAFAGDRGIQKVEVSTDGGSTWEVASLQDPLSNYTWVFWKHDWNPPSSGSYRLQVRATDGTGQVQVATITDPFPNGATGYQVVDVSVSNPST